MTALSPIIHCIDWDLAGYKSVTNSSYFKIKN